MGKFKISSEFKPSGDQPQAIVNLVSGLEDGLMHQVLLGVTGSGKTFTMANVIQQVQKPTLVIAHNKTLAAQLCTEFKEFFPDSAVEYFVSYYDYYQPEAYIASSDTFIEKDSSINEEIDKLRHSATSSLQERRDVIVVASVSCIFSLGDPKEYLDNSISLRPGMKKSREDVIKSLVKIQYERNDIDFVRGTFRVRGDVVEIYQPFASGQAIRIEFFGDEIERISDIEVLRGKSISALSHAAIFPATHYVMNQEKIKEALINIEKDMHDSITKFQDEGKLIEAQRIEQRTMYDMEMIREIGYCNGIENYSRYFDGRVPGESSYTLIDYFPDDFLLIIDESHMTVPQIGAMYAGDRSRKESLVGYGFRLPSAFDNRPLRFDEFIEKIGQVIYVSATPAVYERKKAGQIVEQVIRPTGLVDPLIEVKPVDGQVDDLIGEIRNVTANGFRVLVTTLTKKMSESLTDYMSEIGIRVEYLHSDIDTLKRMDIINNLRRGEFDVLVGINLLREGLDLPEVALVAILDADKEGFLRSTTSLIQTIGRAARNEQSKVIMYANNITKSMNNAIMETNRRREKQISFNKKHGITPQSIVKSIPKDLEISQKVKDKKKKHRKTRTASPKSIQELRELMILAASELKFEEAAKYRDMINEIKAEN